jgi:hypothetical protein
MRSALLALLVLLAAAAEAGACSCVGQSPQQRMAEADAAFIGKVTAVRSEEDDGSNPTFVKRVRVYTVQVEKAYKGAIGATAEVRGEDSSQGAVTSCGERYEVGDTLGGYFKGPPEEWFIFTCNRATREELEDGARGFPEPSGAGTAVALLAGPFASSPFAALDARGRVIAYAKGGGGGFGGVRLSVCPGGRFVVESGPGATRTRRLSDLKIVRRLGKRPGDVRCLDERGTRAIVARADRIERVRGRTVRTVWRGPGHYAAAGQRISVVANGDHVWLIDSRTGRVIRKLPTKDARAVSVSPDGRTAAVLAAELLEYSPTGANEAGRAARASTQDITWDRRGRAMALDRRPGAAFVRGSLWSVRDGKLRKGSRIAGDAPDTGGFPAATVVPLRRAITVRDASRFNPSASGGSPRRARRAQAAGDAPPGDCPTA